MSPADEWRRFERYIAGQVTRTRREQDRQDPQSREKAFANGYHLAFCSFLLMVRRRAKRFGGAKKKARKRNHSGA